MFLQYTRISAISSTGIFDGQPGPGRENLTSWRPWPDFPLPPLIGMRLHSLILAACTGIPFIGISYDPKVIIFRLYNQEPVQVGDGLDDAHLVQAISAILTIGRRKPVMLWLVRRY